jgi:hypothetical protein
MGILYGNVRTLKKFTTILIFLNFHVSGRIVVKDVTERAMLQFAADTLAIRPR